MINSEVFYRTLRDRGIDFFTGVPDSLLKDFCAFITDHATERDHVIAANEGGAVALACGHYLATGKPGLVYMQNSGLGNAINPLISLADRDVYGIPMLLLVGWRGEPGVKDEPQHLKQGRVTTGLLDQLEVPYRLIPETEEELTECLNALFSEMMGGMKPVGLVARSKSFAPYQSVNYGVTSETLTRETAIHRIASKLGNGDIVVSTTGGASRELYEYRAGRKQETGRDFLTIGSMGHAALIAMGIAAARPDRQVICLDGDGSALMHLGAMAIIGSRAPGNLKHIILNNGAHDSVGGQPTAGFSVSFVDIASGCGYSEAWKVETEQDLDRRVGILISTPGPALLEVRVRRGSRPDLGRPKETPKENKESFMKFIQTWPGN